ncbi:probable G-protein coupled receptor Mth-like 6 [Drosophila gunungcola]|uniref:probable G-protein coupled receptor Mth-like 6 n=1 Tax=Drosophila gunungcola TaxID=103775 RepID=UPI0022E4454C|nr:probable G-protein coupled receptor Mth-like 6 [Drosophila gunungcola]
MWQSQKFFGSLIVLMIVSTSRAEISNCSYFDTVDGADHQLKDILGSKGLSAMAKGNYNFKLRADGKKELVKEHSRVCVCHLKACVRFCCPNGKMLAHGKCSDVLEKELLLTRLHLSKTLKNQSVEELPDVSQLIVLRDQSCEERNRLGPFPYTVLKNGTALSKDYNWTLHKGDSLTYMSSVLTKLRAGVREVAVTSMICYILTISAYLYVKKLRNLTGKCFICCLICMFMKCFIWMLDAWNLLDNFRSPACYITHFFWLASFLWFFVLNHKLWKDFGSDKSKIYREIPFVFYNVFVWNTAAVLTGVIIVINVLRKKETWYLNQYFVTIKDPDWLTLIYFYGPMLILTIFNTSLYILTSITILNKEREVKKGLPFFLESA